MVSLIWSLRMKETTEEKSQTRTAAVKSLSPPQQTVTLTSIYKYGHNWTSSSFVMELLRPVWLLPPSEETSTRSRCLILEELLNDGSWHSIFRAEGQCYVRRSHSITRLFNIYCGWQWPISLIRHLLCQTVSVAVQKLPVWPHQREQDGNERE